MGSGPNIVIITTDQQRADVCRREGFPLDTTPFLDSLAEEGAWFNRAYTSMPVCAPARVSLFTGRYPGATRVRTNHNIADAYYEEDLVDILRGQGYATALCGKNHSHLTPERFDCWVVTDHEGGAARDEEEREFDAYLAGLRFGTAMEPTPFPVECQGPHRIVSRATEWLESLERGRRFLLWLSFAEPHSPYQAPEPHYSLFPPEDLPTPVATAQALAGKGFKWMWNLQTFKRGTPNLEGELLRARANYLGMLRLIDDEVKRFVAFLEARDLIENTIIVFLADHGDFVGEYGLMRKGPELPECLVRIPLFFAGPGVVAKPEPREDHVSIVDLMPTLCEASGHPIPEGVQGRSLWPMLTGEDYPSEEFSSAYAEHGFGGLHYTAEDQLNPFQEGALDDVGTGYHCLNSWTQSGQTRMVRRGDWKLVFDMQGRGQLYHLSDDPSELRDLYGTPGCAAIQNELVADLTAWTLRAQDPLPLPRHRLVMKRDPRNYWAPHR